MNILNETPFACKTQRDYINWSWSGRAFDAAQRSRARRTNRGPRTICTQLRQAVVDISKAPKRGRTRRDSEKSPPAGVAARKSDAMKSTKPSN